MGRTALKDEANFYGAGNNGNDLTSEYTFFVFED